jgi:hypothetical protein
MANACSTQDTADATVFARISYMVVLSSLLWAVVMWMTLAKKTRNTTVTHEKSTQTDEYQNTHITNTTHLHQTPARRPYPVERIIKADGDESD